jgi:predicted metal-binding membrane protein
MESATLRRAPPLPGLLQIGLIGLLIALAVVAWAVTDSRMGGMDAGPGTALGSLGFFITAWIVMMAAMMFPSISPMVLMYVRIQEGRREKGQEAPAGATAAFVAGYLVSWGAAGVLSYAIFDLADSLSIDALSWDRGGPYLAGGVILAAALYQLTPLKDACLRKCRNPLMFVLTSWRPGRGGALRMGIEHGGWCVGCCWALMAALFALGVMSIGWMAFIAALIAIEKLLPWKAIANRGIAVTLLVLGLIVAFAPDSVPGLTQPNSAEASQAMKAMGMDEGSMSGGDEGMQGGSMGADKGVQGGSMGADKGVQRGAMGDGGHAMGGADKAMGGGAHHAMGKQEGMTGK